MPTDNSLSSQASPSTQVGEARQVAAEKAMQNKQRPQPRTIQLQAADGIQLFFDLFESPGDQLLVIIPGFWRGRHAHRVQSLAADLARFSAVALLDLRGHGDSTGSYTFGTQEPADVGHVLQHLHTLGYTRIGFLGLSMGGYIAMEAARSHIPDGMEVLGISLVSSPTHVRRARPMFLSPRALRQLQPREAVRMPRFDITRVFQSDPGLSRSRPATETFPVAIYHCQRDWLIPASEAAAWSKILGSRATPTIFPDRKGLHADAMLDPKFPLSSLICEGWRQTTQTHRAEKFSKAQ